MDQDQEPETAERACGCRWQRRQIRPAPGIVSIAFVERCGPHEEMCRSLEAWELDLFITDPEPHD